MGKLNVGDVIKMKNGGEATVLSAFGAGGQGTVYRVAYNGRDYALKWYHDGTLSAYGKAFYENLENNIAKGAPTDAFLWPLGITEVQRGSFGYIMDIRPQGYEEMTRFFVGTKSQPQVRFRSFTAIFTAAIHIIQAFRELHNRGYSYQDINDGNFFIQPTTGQVLICDNDNVSPFGTNLGVLGKQRWMAPEIVTMASDPDKQSDRFSLSVVLFRLLFINHPLEGKYSTPPCMTKALEKKYYGSEPIFVYDPTDMRNRPVPGTDRNLRTFWNVYPQYIRRLFVRAFSQDVLHKRKPRILEKEWLDAFFRLRAETGRCPHCHNETFYTAEGVNTCMECKKSLTKPPVLQTKGGALPLFPGMKLYLWHVDSTFEDITTVISEVVRHPKDARLLGIRNTSAQVWCVTVPDGTQRSLPPSGTVPVREGFRLDFFGGGQTAATIRVP